MTADDVATHAPPTAKVEALIEELRVSPTSNLIGVLQQVQQHFGWLPRPALEEISRRTKIRLSRVYGVVTFYSQFRTQPQGRHTIRCCNGTVCHVKGAGRVLNAVRRTLGIQEGESTPDGTFHLETVACMGACSLAPSMMIEDRCYVRLTPEDVEGILRSYQSGEL